MNKQKLVTLGLILLFIVGLGIMTYPMISQMYYRVEATDKVQEFNLQKSGIMDKDIEKRIELAAAYNKGLDPSQITDPYEKDLVLGRKAYAKMLEIKKLIGHIEIPLINIDIPIYAGTGKDILEKGAGHLEGTSLPIGGDSTHAVITAHRGLPNAELFTNLDKIKIGDTFFVHNIQTVLKYEVDQIEVVEPWDFSKVLVIKDKDYVTLLTCTPYMINSHRLLVRGHRVEYTPPIDDGKILTNEADMKYKDYLMILLPIITVLIIILILIGKDNKNLEKRRNPMGNKEA